MKNRLLINWFVQKKYFQNNPEETLDSVAFFWDWSSGFLVPRVQLLCPVCDSNVLLIKTESFRIHPLSASKYRCNVAFKCKKCSAVWTHGVVIPKDVFDLHGVKSYRYNEIAQILEGKGKS